MKKALFIFSTICAVLLVAGCTVFEEPGPPTATPKEDVSGTSAVPVVETGTTTAPAIETGTMTETTTGTTAPAIDGTTTEAK